MANKLGQLRERGQGLNDKLNAALPKIANLAKTVAAINPKLNNAMGALSFGIGILAMLSDAFKIHDAPPAIEEEPPATDTGETLTNE